SAAVRASTTGAWWSSVRVLPVELGAHLLQGGARRSGVGAAARVRAPGGGGPGGGGAPPGGHQCGDDPDRHVPCRVAVLAGGQDLLHQVDGGGPGRAGPVGHWSAPSAGSASRTAMSAGGSSGSGVGPSCSRSLTGRACSAGRGPRRRGGGDGRRGCGSRLASPPSPSG